MPVRLLFVVNVDWFFLSHRLPIALKAVAEGYEVHIATAITDRLGELQSAGLIVHPIALDRSSASVLGFYRALTDIYAVMRKVKPQIVHLVTIKPVLLGGIAARVARVPAVVSAISGLGSVFIADGWRARLRRWLVGRAYRLAFGHPNIRVIFQNRFDQETLAAIGKLRAHNTRLIRGSGVPLDAYRSLPRSGPVTVMFAARLIADKGLREYVDAARRLRPAHPEIRFVVVGDIDPPNPTSFTSDEIAAMSREAHVEFWGHRTDMAATLSRADIVVLPSYREGLPKVLIEAAACGRAVVTTDVPGCRDAIEPDETGLLVPARNAVALASAIDRLLRSEETRRRMGAAGRQLAEKAFDVRAVVDDHLAIYRELLTVDHL